ncbi:MAG: helix-turn-helix domain-containing protein [Alphaproteobacteria bacterium]|uniref:Putative DNA binding, helix-turn-helix domain containing protein n=1 Tax=viral metagenome TaxID=1070528 RepID=A0A6H1ZJS9_9ZZZZ|nr:helix-turn-helix domain-containing protein [Alphaproteobacteria bacterium]MBU2377872.1 helix-turn-helix domain-containing protein [Alphaproteobacteria bacterium]
MFHGLEFGWRTAVLLTAVSPMLVIAAALPTAITNRLANRTLAALLVVMTGVVTPWMIGFAGFYDRWQILSFVPLSLNLAVMPLIWLYVTALVTGDWPARGWLHLLPAGAQAALKVAESQTGFVPALAPLADLALLVGFVFYGLRVRGLLSHYRRALAEHRADDARFAVAWIGAAWIAIVALFLLSLGHKVWGLFQPLGYRGLMGLHVGLALIGLYLAVEGWRHASLKFPHLRDLSATPAPTPRDWSQLGRDFAERVRREDWLDDPELTLPVLARHLGTNAAYASRAFNEGLGIPFSDFVNGERSARVAAMIEAGRREDLLDLALEAGFASKATFNRAFRRRFGVSPSTFRRRLKS